MVPGPVLKNASLGGRGGRGVGLAKQARGQHVMRVLNRAIPPPPPPGAVVVVDSPFFKKRKTKTRKVKTATLSIKQEKEAKPQTSIFN